MEITNSPFNYGLTGLHNSQSGLSEASQKVADASTKTVNNSQASRESNYGSQMQNGLVEAKQSELNAKANARVLDSSDKTIGSLIDIKV